MNSKAFGKAFEFLVKVFRLEQGTEGGRVNLGIVVLLILAITVMYASNRLASALEAIVGSDSADFPLLAVVLVLAGLTIFCVTMLVVSESIRKRAGRSDRDL